MPVSFNPTLCDSFTPMGPPAPLSVDELSARAGVLAKRLEQLHVLWSVTQDDDILGDRVRLSAHYDRTLAQLAQALDRERRQSAFGASFDLPGGPSGRQPC